MAKEPKAVEWKSSPAYKAWLELISLSAEELTTGLDIRPEYQMRIIGLICQLDSAGLERLAVAIDSAND